MSVEFSPSRAMNLLHLKMINKFKSKTVEQDKLNAKDLELFFQALKSTDIASTQSPEAQAFIQEVKNNIQKQSPRLHIDKLFRHAGGKKFEIELARVQSAVTQALSGEITSVKGYMTGTETRSAMIIDFDKVTPEVLEKVGIKFQKSIKGVEMPGYYVKGGQSIKIDNKNLLSIHLIANPTLYMEKIFTLFQQASFTAKNYGSESTKYHQAYENLSLGRTNIGTILLDVLPYLTGSHWTSFLRIIALNTSDPSVMLHVQHLRQAYELVGLGQQSDKISREHGGAKYLIYNDPSTNHIYVSATSAIVANILESNTYRRDPFTSYITEISRNLLTITATDYKQVL